MDFTLHPSGVVCIKVEGLGSGVGNVAGSANHGYICIVAGSGTTTKADGLTPIARAHLFFLEHIVRPFVVAICKMLGWKEG